MVLSQDYLSPGGRDLGTCLIVGSSGLGVVSQSEAGGHGARDSLPIPSLGRQLTVVLLVGPTPASLGRV